MGKKMGVRALGSAEVQKQSDAALTEVITKGKAKMPAYGGKMTPDEIKALVAHIRSLAKK
jgi:cytochrome c6